MISRDLPAARHRAIHLWMLHSQFDGFVEITPGTRPPGRQVHIDRRQRPEHYLPVSPEHGWLAPALEYCEEILSGAYARGHLGQLNESREECFVGVTCRTARAGNKENVSHSRWLWVDIDHADKLHLL
ncbi:MAG: hypothetical protein ABSG43_22580 [Solirubrobacteraceae bacterium]